MNGCAPGLALKERLWVTRKWSIDSHMHSCLSTQILDAKTMTELTAE